MRLQGQARYKQVAAMTSPGGNGMRNLLRRYGFFTIRKYTAVPPAPGQTDDTFASLPLTANRIQAILLYLQTFTDL